MHLQPIREAVSLSLSINGVYQSRLNSKTPVPPMATTVEERVSQFCHLKTRHTIEHVNIVPGFLQPIFHATAANGHHYLLKSPPLATTRLLRQERDGLTAEIKVLKMISSSRMTAPLVVSQESSDSASNWPHALLDYGSSIPLTALKPLSTTQQATLVESAKAWVISVASVQSNMFGTMTQEFRRSSWPSCFGEMFEAMLREAEDMFVTLPYDQIRFCIRRYQYTLGPVVTPRLVFPKAALLDNMMVDPSSMTVTGLVDYSSAVWADPEMVVFPSTQDITQTTSNPLEDQKCELAMSRRLLYEVYASASEVISHCLRVQSTEIELESRKALMKALSSLLNMSMPAAADLRG